MKLTLWEQVKQVEENKDFLYEENQRLIRSKKKYADWAVDAQDESRRLNRNLTIVWLIVWLLSVILGFVVGK